MKEVLLPISEAAQLRGIKTRTLKTYIRQYKIPSVCQLEPPFETFVPLSYILNEVSEGLKTIEQVKKRGWIQVSKQEASKHYVICTVRCCNMRFYFIRPERFYDEQYKEVA